MNYKNALQELSSFNMSRINLGLDAISNAAKILGNPHLGYKTVHIAGTNGKGSVACLTSHILSCAGFKVGMYSSPHLCDVRERIRIWENGKSVLISQKDFSEYFFKIKNLDLTYFEVLTIMAFLYFKDQGVDFAIIETGLGGRLDATNILENKLSVITNISFDHMDFLGNGLSKIAHEKFGIIKKGNTVISGIRQKKLQLELVKFCKVSNASCELLDRKKIKNVCVDNFGMSFDFVLEDLKIKKIFIPSQGLYQVENACLALLVVSKLVSGLSLVALREAISNFYWEGRMDSVAFAGKELVFEGAHNLDGVKFLEKKLKQEKEKPVIVLGILKDKAYKQMISRLAPYASTIFINTSFYKERSVDAEILRKECLRYCDKVFLKEDINELLEYIKNFNCRKVYVTGSLYLVGRVKVFVQERHS